MICFSANIYRLQQQVLKILDYYRYFSLIMKFGKTSGVTLKDKEKRGCRRSDCKLRHHAMKANVFERKNDV